jgi:hypothetical protein
MGLGGALVDRARIIRQEVATVARVGGSSQTVPVDGNWFRARLELPAGPEGRAPEFGRMRAVVVPTLLYEGFDEENLDVYVTAEDRIEVESLELGRGLWQVTGSPTPIRKKSDVIGFQATLKKISQRELRRPSA